MPRFVCNSHGDSPLPDTSCYHPHCHSPFNFLSVRKKHSKLRTECWSEQDLHHQQAKDPVLCFPGRKIGALPPSQQSNKVLLKPKQSESLKLLQTSPMTLEALTKGIVFQHCSSTPHCAPQRSELSSNSTTSTVVSCSLSAQ